MEKNGNLLITADDLGLAECVNDGIFFAAKNGFINSTAIMANGEAFYHAVKGLKEIPQIYIGIHLILVGEKSILKKKEIPSLIGRNNLLFKNHKIFFIRYLLCIIKKEEIRKELEAQIKICLQNGIKPCWLNSHQHLHLLPAVSDIVIELAKKYGIPYLRIMNEPLYGPGSFFRKLQLIVLNFLGYCTREKAKKAGLKTNDFFVGFVNAGRLCPEDFKKTVMLKEKYPGKQVELGCHPGFENPELRRRYEHWHYHWENDIKVLSDFSDECRNLEQR